MMQQRHREERGFKCDPEEEDDIHEDEEFSSEDYDSDDVHSSVGGNSDVEVPEDGDLLEVEEIRPDLVAARTEGTHANWFKTFRWFL